jgi:hypothetical protein
MKSRLIAVAFHKRVICGNDRFAPDAVISPKSALLRHEAPPNSGAVVQIVGLLNTLILARRPFVRDLEVKPVTLKGLIDEFEVPPLPGIGTKARCLHVGFQCLTVVSRDPADQRV